MAEASIAPYSFSSRPLHSSWAWFWRHFPHFVAFVELQNKVRCYSKKFASKECSAISMTRPRLRRKGSLDGWEGVFRHPATQCPIAASRVECGDNGSIPLCLDSAITNTREVLSWTIAENKGGPVLGILHIILP